MHKEFTIVQDKERGLDGDITYSIIRNGTQVATVWHTNRSSEDWGLRILTDRSETGYREVYPPPSESFREIVLGRGPEPYELTPRAIEILKTKLGG